MKFGMSASLGLLLMTAVVPFSSSQAGVFRITAFEEDDSVMNAHNAIAPPAPTAAAGTPSTFIPHGKTSVFEDDSYSTGDKVIGAQPAPESIATPLEDARAARESLRILLSGDLSKYSNAELQDLQQSVQHLDAIIAALSN